MTPPATAAVRSARRAASMPNRVAPRRPASARVAVRHPRRISGPAKPIAAAAAPAIALPAPRPAAPRRPARRRRAEAPGLALRTAGALAGATNSPLLERLIRSRLWIGILAFSLIGIVAMQLLVLKLNTDIGATLAREAALQRQNTLTRIEDSSASAGNLVEPAAATAGMTIAPPGSLHFVAVSPSDLTRAAEALRTPVGEAVASREAPQG